MTTDIHVVPAIKTTYGQTCVHYDSGGIQSPMPAKCKAGVAYADVTITVLATLAAAGHDVYVAGLSLGWMPHEDCALEAHRFNWDWQRGQLDSVSHRHIFMEGVCGYCGKPAWRTRRLTPWKPGDSVITSNRDGSCVPTCDKCWRPPPKGIPNE